MRKRLAGAVLLMMLVLGCLAAAGAEGSGMLRVYLQSLGKQTSLSIAVRGSYAARGSETVSLTSGSAVTVTVGSGGALTLSYGGYTVSMGSSVTLCRGAADDGESFTVGSCRYPGDLRLTAQQTESGWQLVPILYVYIEDYVRGVVPCELGGDAPIEAMKAQAVAARTYALSRMEARGAASWDVTDSTSDQVYRGDPTDTRCDEAVEATRGVVLTWGGSLCEALYTSSNGGQTETAVHAWNGPAYPYLPLKDDPYDAMASGAVTRTLTVWMDDGDERQSPVLRSLLTEKARSYLEAWGISTEGLTLCSVDGMELNSPLYDGGSRVYGGLDIDVTVFSDETYRQLSLSFSIFQELEEPLGLSINASQNELWSVTEGDECFQITVKRYGHGIGMSQFGAMQMAELGGSYEQILGFYYEGASLETRSYTADVDEPPVQQGHAMVRARADGLPLAMLDEASPAGNVLLGLPAYTQVTVLRRDDDWCLAELGGAVGWIPSAGLRFGAYTDVDLGGEVSSFSGWATVSSDGWLNLREQPSYEGALLDTLDSGEVVAVLLEAGEWCYVRHLSQEGWVVGSFLTFSDSYPEAVSLADMAGTVTTADGTGTVNLREAASTDAGVLARVGAGTGVTLLQKLGGWCLIDANGMRGYMMSAFLSTDGGAEPIVYEEPDPTAVPSVPGELVVGGTAWVDAASLRLRAGPFAEATILTNIPRGTELPVYALADGWCRTAYDGQIGYVSTAYLSTEPPEDESETVFATAGPTAAPQESASGLFDSTLTQVWGVMAMVHTSDGSMLNLRAWCKTDAPVVATMQDGDVVELTERGETWSKIIYGELEGYCMTKYLILY